MLHDRRKYLKDYFLLRWSMTYTDGKRVTGMWSQPGVDLTTKASMQPRAGLMNVAIEGKHRASKEIKVLAIRHGETWREVKWVSAVRTPMAAIKANGEASVAPNIHGMQLLTDYEKITVTIDGNVVNETLKGA